MRRGQMLVAGLAGLWVLSAAAPAWARIKLATLPPRERVEIQLDNPNYTLVEEERIVTLLQSTPQRGNNRIDFSWSNTAIDKDSIQFRPVLAAGAEDTVRVINVSYPPNENALVWEVFAAKPGPVKVRISYLISNLRRDFNYRAIAAHNEKTLVLRNYIKMHNFSGEQFGTSSIWAGFGPDFKKEVGLNEAMQMLLAKFEEVPIKKAYTYDWYVYGPLSAAEPTQSKVPMHYVLVNDEKHKLGKFPLQPGKVRIFQQDGHGGVAFLGEDWTGFTPIDDETRLYLGLARDVVCKRTIDLNKRHVVRGNLFDQEIVIKYEIENFKKEPATLDIVERMNRLARELAGDPHGDAEWELGGETGNTTTFRDKLERKGGDEVIFHIDLPAAPKDPDAKVKKTVHRFHLTIKNVW